jgi:hypothetical protein
MVSRVSAFGFRKPIKGWFRGFRKPYWVCETLWFTGFGFHGFHKPIKGLRNLILKKQLKKLKKMPNEWLKKNITGIV